MPKIEVKRNKVFGIQFNKQSKARYFYDIGSRWSGKTFSILQDIILDCIKNPNYRAVVCRKVYSSIKSTVFDDTLQVIRSMGLEYSTHYTKTVSPLAIYFNNGANLIFKGADSPEKLKGISSAHCLFLEELNEFTREDFETLDMSMRGKDYQTKTYLAHNPVPLIPGMTPWFKELFDPGNLVPGEPVLIDKEGLGLISALKSTYQHNMFCPKAVRDRLEGYKITNPNLYQLWALGNYAKMEGAILDNWDVVSRVPDGVEFISYGLDFGFSNDPAALTALWANSTDLWVECLVYKTGLQNDELAELMRESGVSSSDKIIADSAEPKSIDWLFRRENFRGIRGVKKRANYKTDMANYLRSLNIHLIEGSTPLQTEFSTWSWDTDKDGNFLPRPRDGGDHAIDSIVMALYDYKGVTNRYKTNLHY